MIPKLFFRTCKRGVLASTCAALLVPINSNADLLEEVIVTAKKREENLQDVSVSVTAFSGDTLDDFGLSSSNDLGQYIPGVEIQAVFGNQQAKAFIRGSGAVDFSANTQTTVGMYVDEVYLFNTFMQTMQTFDLERVEVLRGPQGTLYGRNATGGAINFITAKPTQELSGYAKAGYGNYDAVHLEGAVSGGLTDTLAGRVAFQLSNDDGWMENRLTGEDVNATDFYSWRTMLEWTPQENLSVLWSVNGARDTSDSFSYQHVGATDPVTFGPCDGTVRDDCLDFGRLNGAGAQVGPRYRDPDGIEDRGDPTKGDFDLVDEVDNGGVGTTLRIEWELDKFQLTSITSWSDFEREYAGDDDASPNNLSHNYYQHDTDGWSQELRLTSTSEGPLDWLLGFYYAEDELDAVNTYEFNIFSLFTTFQRFHQEQEAMAAFGNLGYQINDQWKVSVGLRITQDEVSMDHESDSFDPPFPDGFGGGFNGSFSFLDGLPVWDSGTSGSEDYEDLSWKLGVDYTPNENWLIYASVGTGYKSGGINVGFGDPREFNIYDEETITAWEVGFKSTLWDGRGRLNVSAFYYDYEDLQVFDAARGAFSQLNILDNAPEADYYGAEAEFIVNPVEGLNLMLGASYLETEFGSFIRQGFGFVPDLDVKGNRNVFAPEWKFTGLVSYEWNTPSLMDGKMAASLNWSWTDEVFHSIENTSDVRGKEHWLAGARLAWISQDDKLEIALWSKNLTDEEFRVQSFDLASVGFVTSVPNRPRTYGAEILYRF